MLPVVDLIDHHHHGGVLPGGLEDRVAGVHGGLGTLPDQVPGPLQGPDDALPQPGVVGLQACRGDGGQRFPGQLVAAAGRVELDEDRVLACGDPFADVVEHVGLAAAGHAVDADRLAAFAVEQDELHRLAGLGDDPDRDGRPDAAALGEPRLVRRVGVERGVGDRAFDRRVVLPDLDDQLAGILGGPDVDPAVGQAAQVRVLLRVGPAVRRHAGGQLAAGGAGEQQFLAEVCLGGFLQVEVAQADQVRDPVPFGLAGCPRGMLVPARARGQHGRVPAQPPVAQDGAGQVDPGQQVRGPAERPGRHRGGHPSADRRGDHGGLGGGQARVRGSLGVPPPCQPGDRYGCRRDEGNDVAGDMHGMQCPRCRPGGHDQRQRQPLGRGVQVPGPQPGPR
jgi:hypothetical protein